MGFIRLAALCLAFSLGACVATTERVTLVPGPQQEILPANGHEWLASRHKVTHVGLIHPPGFSQTGKWVPFALLIRNRGRNPIEFRMQDASVLYKGKDGEVVLPFKTLEQIEEEERKRHATEELVIGSLAYANVSLAMQARSGVGQARRERRETMEGIEREHLQNLEALRRYALRDHTLEPGGLTQAMLLVELPEAHEPERHYAIRIKLGDELHEFEVVQTIPKS
jgi:hypothetical protein